MDPLSITAACFTLIATLSKTSYSLLEFSQGVRDSKGDLDAIQSELQSFQNIIETLCQQFVGYDKTPVPPSLIQHVFNTLKDCDIVINEIDMCLKKHSRSVLGKSGYWTLGGGKNDMAERRIRLEAQKSLLGLLLDMFLFHITQATKKETAQIPSIKQDTTRILKALDLKSQSSIAAIQSGPKSRNHRLKKYLQSMSCRTESACCSSADEPPPDYEESMEDYKTVAGSTYSAPQRRYDQSRPFPSVPFLPDAWNYSPISWTISHYDYSSSLSSLYGWSNLSRSNVNSGSSVFVKLTPWVDASLDNPSLAFETVYQCLPNDFPVLRLGRRCETRVPNPNCIYFDTRAVSRTHCEVYRNDKGKWYIRDLGSLSGTFLNTRRLSNSHMMSKSTFLREGNVIELGKNIEGFVHQRVKMMISAFDGWDSC